MRPGSWFGDVQDVGDIDNRKWTNGVVWNATVLLQRWTYTTYRTALQRWWLDVRLEGGEKKDLVRDFPKDGIFF